MSQSIKYQHWVIKNQPSKGFVLDPKAEDATFELKTDRLSDDLQDNDVLVQELLLSNDPAQRFWIYSPVAPDYGAKLPVGSEVTARAVGKVLKSKDPKYQEGDYIFGQMGWSEYFKINTSKVLNYKINTDVFPISEIPLELHLSLLGITSLTAYIGFFAVGRLDVEKDAGKVYLITGAAGAVGSIAVQIASKILKAKKVIAVAGGNEKVHFVESLGENIIGVDYKDPNFKENLKKAVGGERINFLFENVGGEIFEYALQFLELRATVAYCGAISTYQDKKPRPFFSFPLVVSKRLTISGFVVSDYSEHFDEYRADLSKWYKQGKLLPASTVIDASGEKFNKIPEVWQGLYEGANKGKLITKISKA